MLVAVTVVAVVLFIGVDILRLRQTARFRRQKAEEYPPGLTTPKERR